MSSIYILSILEAQREKNSTPPFFTPSGHFFEMGKKKGGKKFNKKGGQQYVVVHRSQQDPLYGDKNATDYVLASVNVKAYEAMEDDVRFRSTVANIKIKHII